MAQPGQDIQLTVQRLDGGLNCTDSPQELQVNESPDCLNVVFDGRGGVRTRYGSAIYNSTPIGTSAVIDGIGNYNETMVVWAGGTMYRMSGTMAVTIPSAQCVFATGSKIAHVIYQNQMFMSDGTNGPYRYTGDGFYRMGVAVPSAPTAICNVTGANLVPTGLWYYKISYVNTGVVEGDVGSCSLLCSNTASAAVVVSGIPLGADSMAVASRYIYRASTPSETFRWVGELTNNTATIFTDTMGMTTWAVEATPVEDGTAPTPFTTIALHKEHLWFDDSSARSLLRYTDYGVPYISAAENFIPLAKGDLSNITAIAVQDDYVTAFKGNSIWAVDLVTPGTTTSYQWIKLPVNLGITGPRAFVEWEGGVLFAGKWNGKITGFHNLQGLDVSQTADNIMRSQKITDKLDSQINQIPSAMYDDIAMIQYGGAIYIAHGAQSATANDHIYWFDPNRLSDPGSPGSWARWDGRPCQVTCFTVVGSNLYAGSSLADGRLIRLEVPNSFADPDGGINSYWWSKQIGGEEGMDNWFKDWRKLNLFYALLGDWDFNLKYREGGTSGSGNNITVDANPGGSLWGTMVWGTSMWGGGATDAENQYDLGTFVARRAQFKFDNNYSSATVSANSGLGFQVYKFSTLGNLRRLI